MGRKHKPTPRRDTSRQAADHVARDTGASALPPPVVGPEPGSAADTPSLGQDTGATASACEPAALPPPPPPLPIPVATWQLCGDAVIGLAHRRKGLPCQDAVAFRNLPRPILALSDGAGSAAISERGAQAMVIGVSRFLCTMEDDLAPWLDGDDKATQAHATIWSERLRLHAQGLLADLARAERRDVRDVRATLQVAIIGERHIFWWKVGDGAIVARNSEKMWALGNQAIAKGEFANQTCFVDTASAADVQSGVLSAGEVCGIVLMSDGGAERLVANDGSKVADRLGKWLDDVAEQRFSTDQIALAFHDPKMWERTNLDDRSLVLAARPCKMGLGARTDRACGEAAGEILARHAHDALT